MSYFLLANHNPKLRCVFALMLHVLHCSQPIRIEQSFHVYNNNNNNNDSNCYSNNNNNNNHNNHNHNNNNKLLILNLSIWTEMRVLPKQFKLGLEPGVLNPESFVSTSTSKSSTYIHIYEVVK